MVELSPSSEDIPQFESTGSSLREAVNAGALSDDATEIDDERDSAAKYTPCSKRGLAAKYIPCSKRDSAAKYYPPEEEDDERDSAAKYVPYNGGTDSDQEKLINYGQPRSNDDQAEGLNVDEDAGEIVAPGWSDTSDPLMEQVIINLTDRSSMFSNPFQLTEHIRETLIRQAEQSGARAISWSLSDFDKIGGKNTLRTVWSSLKSERRVRGVKRNAESSAEETEKKKLCVSLDVSGTCNILSRIVLRSSDSSDVSVLRHDSDSDSSIDVSQLLRETRDNGLSGILVQNANELLMNIEEELPALTPASETESYQSEYQDFSSESEDSGNSEVKWGFTNIAKVEREGGLRNVEGTIVPVSLGHSSLSDTSEEVERILGQLERMSQTYSDSGDGDCIQVSSSGTEGEGQFNNDEEYGEERYELYIDDMLSWESINVGNDELGSNDECATDKVNEHDECTSVESGGMIDNGYWPDDERSSNSDSGECYGEEWLGGEEEEESGPTGQVTGTARRPQSLATDVGECYGDEWARRGEEEESGPTGQVTGTARRPQDLATNLSQIREGVSDRATLGGGTMGAIGSSDDYNSSQEIGWNLLLDEVITDRNLEEGEGTQMDKLEVAEAVEFQ